MPRLVSLVRVEVAPVCDPLIPASARRAKSIDLAVEQVPLSNELATLARHIDSEVGQLADRRNSGRK